MRTSAPSISLTWHAFRPLPSAAGWLEGNHLDRAFRLVGDLTIRDVTREVMDVSAQGRLIDPWGAERAGFSAHGKIDRTDFGLTWNQALETGGVLVGNEVKISIEVEWIWQANQAAA